MKYSIVEMEMKADVRLQTIIRRGDSFMAELPKGIGCEQGGRRPVVVIQNDIGNFRSPLVIVASVTGAQETNADPCAAWQGAGAITPFAVIVRVDLYD